MLTVQKIRLYKMQIFKEKEWVSYQIHDVRSENSSYISREIGDGHSSLPETGRENLHPLQIAHEVGDSNTEPDKSYHNCAYWV
jgi:hypothetical protein